MCVTRCLPSHVIKDWPSIWRRGYTCPCRKFNTPRLQNRRGYKINTSRAAAPCWRQRGMYSVSLQATKTPFTGAQSHKFGKMAALKRTECYPTQLLLISESLSLTLTASSHTKPLCSWHGHCARSHRFLLLVLIKKCKGGCR